MNFEENQPNVGRSSVPADRARRFWWWNSEPKKTEPKKTEPQKTEPQKTEPQKCNYELHEGYDLRQNFKIGSCQLFYNIFKICITFFV